MTAASGAHDSTKRVTADARVYRVLAPCLILCGEADLAGYKCVHCNFFRSSQLTDVAL